MTRIQSLQRKLRKNDGAILFDEANRRYYTGIDTSDGYVLVSKNRAVFYTDSRYITVARNEVKDTEVALDEGKMREDAAEFFASENVKTVLFEARSMPYASAKALMDTMPGFTFVSGDKIFAAIRMVKGREELACMRKAQKITDRSFKYICGYIARNKGKKLTERQIAVELEAYMQRHGSGKPAFDTIVASGENSACPHAIPGDRVIRDGDFITLDFGASYGGYCSDMTRTVAVGHVSDKQKKVYELVLEAQKRALAAARAGVRGCDVDAVARDFLKENGYGREYFGHGLGHSVGLYIHEEPRFSPACTEVLKPHVVETVEPGVYIPGEFGVRIEDMIVLTADGCRDLTESEKNLIIL